jgi:peroxiredoxin (alkyl hydroperoxide reductase subunit C)
MLEVGTTAPYFTLKSHDNEEVTLSSFQGDKWVVLHTFPAAFTGG